MQYFYLIPVERFQKLVVPAMISSWRRRNLNEIIVLRSQLTAEMTGPVSENLPLPSDLQLARGARAFRPDVWRILVAETLLLASVELPEIETPLESWAKLLGQRLGESRLEFSPIQKALLGGRDLFLGCYYRPENTGWNDFVDVCQHFAWLQSAHPENWRSEALTHVAAEDREDELAYSREWFELFVGLFRRAEQAKFVIVSERI
jgi:hypothetical protein